MNARRLSVGFRARERWAPLLPSFIGLPPALVFLGLYGSILIQYLNASVFA